jgi:DME family drug/metabolite transporter
MLKAYLYIFIAAFCWGFIGIFSSLAFSFGIEPMEVAFWRAVLAWVCFAIYAVIKKETKIEIKDAPLLLLFGIFGVAVFYISYQYAVKEGGAAFASVLLYTAPAWVVFFSMFIYKEKLTKIKLGTLFLVIFGVVLISKGSVGTTDSIKIISSGTLPSLGYIAIISGLGSGLCYSLYYTMGKYFSKKYTSANLFFYVLPVGALGIYPFVNFTHKSPGAWTALILVAVISTFFANIFYYLGLKSLEAGKASIVATLEPVIAAITAYIFLGEYFSLSGYTGAIFILLAVFITIYKKEKEASA